MITKRTKSAPLNIYIDPHLKEAAVKAAKADQRSLTSLIEKLLTEHCRAAGHLPADGKPGKGKPK